MSLFRYVINFSTNSVRLLYIVLALFTHCAKAQLLNRTIGNYSSELTAREVKGKSLVTKIIYSPGSGALTIEDNLAAVYYRDSDSMNYLNKVPVFLKFQTNLQGTNLNQVFHTNKYGTLLCAEGTLSINGISKECVAYYAPLVINNSNGELLLDFTLYFNLADFGLSRCGLLEGLIELDIEDGFVVKIE